MIARILIPHDAVVTFCQRNYIRHSWGEIIGMRNRMIYGYGQP